MLHKQDQAKIFSVYFLLMSIVFQLKTWTTSVTQSLRNISYAFHAYHAVRVHQDADTLNCTFVDTRYCHKILGHFPKATPEDKSD